MLEYKYIFQIKYTETILFSSTRKRLWFEITKIPMAVLRNKFTVLLIIIVGTLSSTVGHSQPLPLSASVLHIPKRSFENYVSKMNTE